MSIEVSGKVIRSENDGMAIRFDNGFKMLPLGNKLKKKIITSSVTGMFPVRCFA